jgi:N-carbamoylputrescine amidase
VKIAAIQFSAGSDSDRTLKKAAQFLEAASMKGVRIACFAELFAWPWFPAERSDAAFELAEPLGGRITGRIAELAAKYKIAVVCPFFEKGEDGAYYNSAAVFDASGTTVGVYRKVHVPNLQFWEEKHYFKPGDAFPVFEVEGVKIGVQLCWDNFFPEGFRSLALSGAEIVFLPTAAAFASQERWLAMAVSHAIANGIFVVRVNRVGKEANLDFYGQSFCVRPDGELAIEPLEMNEGVLLADCDLAMVEWARRMWPFLRDRRPELYGQVTKA